MAMNRRELLTSLGTAAAAATLRRDLGAAPAPTDGPAGFPRKTDFAFEKGWTYISGAYTHPMPIAAADAYREVVTRRGTVGAPPPPTSSSRVDPRAAFAALINAMPSEISYIPNTSAGENLVVECLGITKFDGNGTIQWTKHSGKQLRLGSRIFRSTNERRWICCHGISWWCYRRPGIAQI